MPKTLALVTLILVAAPLAGCIESMRDLKDKLDGSEAAVQQASAVVNETADALRNSTKNTTNAKPPVARIAVFGANGALVYKASFVAADEAAPVAVEEGVELTLVGTDSEGVGGATIKTYAWRIDANTTTGPKATVKFEGAGKHPVVLTVTDNNGLTDTQSLALVVPPKPFDVVLNLTTTQIVGSSAAATVADGTASFDVMLADAGVPAIVQAVKVEVAARDTCDAVLSVLDADKNVIGNSDEGGVSTKETATMGALPEGTYGILVEAGDACVEKDGVPVTVTITFLPILDGVEMGDGDGDAHG